MRTREIVLALAAVGLVAAGVTLRVLGGDDGQASAADRTSLDPELDGSEVPFRPFAVEEDLDRPGPVETGFPFVPGVLHRPDFGPELERAGGSAAVDLVDDAQRTIPSLLLEGAKLRLWRRVGSLYQEMDLHLEGSTVVSHGIGGAGLEPGRYRLEASVPGLGRIDHEFSVARGEAHHSFARFPRTTRVVTLRLVTPELQPVRVLDGRPSFSAPPAEALPDRSDERLRILRGPPDRPREERARPTPEAAHGEHAVELWLTDHGLFHVPVVTGAAGAIEWRSVLGAFRSTSSFHLESDFHGPEWEERQVVLELSPDSAQRFEGARVANPDDPGLDALAGKPGAIADPGSAAETRVPFALHGPHAEFLQPRLYQLEGRPEDAPSRLGPGAVLLPLEWTAERWTAQLVPGRAHLLVTGDGAMYLPPPSRFVAEAGTPVDREVEIDATPVEMRLHLSPTSAAYSRHTTCLVPHHAEHASWHGAMRSFDRVDATTFAATLLLDAETAARLRADPLLGVALGWHDDEILRFNESWFDVPGENTQTQLLRLEGPALDRLEHGDLDLDLTELPTSTPRVVVRLVDPRGAGLPWVESSLLRAEDDALAQVMRRRLATLGSPAERQRVEIFERTFDGILPSHLEDERTAVRVLGHRACELFDATPLRKRLYDQGTWYETRSLAVSDAYGYLIHADPRLAAGGRYVLYLWSLSRDDLRPDLRLEFEATGPVSDLGVVTMSID